MLACEFWNDGETAVLMVKMQVAIGKLYIHIRVKVKHINLLLS